MIHQSGILEKVESYNNGASISVTNTVFDKQTGEVVVTEAKNEFGQTEYGLNVPAYWPYRGMGAAYKNQGMKLTVSIPTSTINYARLFNVGDEVMVSDLAEVRTGGPLGTRIISPPKKAWVLQATTTRLSLIDELGTPFRAGTYTVEVLRSGNRNHVSESAGSLLSLEPLVSDGKLKIPSEGIVNAGASSYHDLWQTYAAFTATQPQYQCNCQPFSDKNNRTSKTLVENFIRTLYSNGDYKRVGVNLSNIAYAEFASFLNDRLGRGNRTLNALHSSSQITWDLFNSDSTSCRITLEMADDRVPLPDSITAFSIDLTLTDPAIHPECDNAYTAYGTITFSGKVSNTTARVKITSSCFPFMMCSERYTGGGEIECSSAGEGVVNPFISGIMGNWRKSADYAYRSEREGTSVAAGGTLADFKSFFTDSFKVAPRGSTSSWLRADAATVYDPYGRNIESKSSIGIYSSEVYGYGFSVPVLAASNARYLTAAFDGFEDYQYKNAASNPWGDCRILPHFKFEASEAKIDHTVSHTGSSSLRVESRVSLTRNFYAYADRDAPSISEGKFTASRDNLIQPFTPAPGKYIFSAWVSYGVPGSASSSSSSGSFGGITNPGLLKNIGELLNDNLPSTLSGGGTTIGGPTGIAPGTVSIPDVTIKVTTSAGATTTLASATGEGKSIDGWKQINAEFTIPDNVRSITIELSPGSKAWYDDIRLQPVNSMMKTFVYDPASLRVMAVLDENNYASMFEYNAEGVLVRTKKETEDGIVTLQEIRSAKSKTR